MILYHLTWDCNVPDILREGLIPSRRPSRWASNSARERSKGKLFLCLENRREHWYYIYADGWASPPSPDDDFKLAWLRIDATGLNLTPDKANNGVDDYTGDYYTREVIPPERITVLPMDGIYSQGVQ